jgi:hypothetical protein
VLRKRKRESEEKEEGVEERGEKRYGGREGEGRREGDRIRKSLGDTKVSDTVITFVIINCKGKIETSYGESLVESSYPNSSRNIANTGTSQSHRLLTRC